MYKPLVTGDGGDGRHGPPPSGTNAKDAVPEGRGGKSVGASQDFTNVKNNLHGKLYEDPDFPPTDESIYYSQRPPRKFEWKRPHVYSYRFILFIDPIDHFIINRFFFRPSIRHLLTSVN